MFQLITAVLMSWVFLFYYMQWKPLLAHVKDDGTYIHVTHVFLALALMSAFTVVSYAFLGYVVKWFINGT